MESADVRKVLQGCEFFDLIGPEDLDRIAAICRPESYETGETVFQQGDFGDSLFVIAEGQITLERSVDLGERKGIITVEALGKGRVMGSWSTLLDERHLLMSSAVCQKPSKVLVMRGAELRKIMVSNLELGFHVMERFCFLLRDRIQAVYGAVEKI
jgi:CRP-like cAMP-binding protein